MYILWKERILCGSVRNRMVHTMERKNKCGNRCTKIVQSIESKNYMW